MRFKWISQKKDYMAALSKSEEEKLLLKISIRMIHTIVILIRNILILILIGVLSKSFINIYHLFAPHKMESLTETVVWVTIVVISVAIAVPLANHILKWLLLKLPTKENNQDNENGD
jgi:hypothetical protein